MNDMTASLRFSESRIVAGFTESQVKVKELNQSQKRF